MNGLLWTVVATSLVNFAVMLILLTFHDYPRRQEISAGTDVWRMLQSLGFLIWSAIVLYMRLAP